MSFSQVCAGWYSAVDLGRELAVKDTNMAERCARFLAKKGVEERSRIRSLSIKIEEKGAGRGQRVANVVKACPQVEALELLGIGLGMGASGHPLGAPLTLALKSLSKMKSFKVVPSRQWRLGCGEFMVCVNFSRRLALRTD